MGRPVWKGPYFSLSLYQSIMQDMNSGARRGVITYSRNSTIIPAFVGAKLFIHDGKSFVPLIVKEEMVGKHVGDFAPTKKAFSYRATNAQKKSGK